MTLKPIAVIATVVLLATAASAEDKCRSETVQIFETQNTVLSLLAVKVRSAVTQKFKELFDNPIKENRDKLARSLDNAVKRVTGRAFNQSDDPVFGYALSAASKAEEMAEAAKKKRAQVNDFIDDNTRHVLEAEIMDELEPQFANAIKTALAAALTSCTTTIKALFDETL
jgi:hypothetical protein